MSTDDDRTTLLASAGRSRDAEGDDGNDADRTAVPTGTIASASTTIGGESVDTEDPQTSITFEDDSGFFAGKHGRPRPRKFFHASNLGSTAPMQVVKNIVTRQLTGGEIKAVPDGDDDELDGDARALANLAIDIMAGSHFQAKDKDDLLADAVKDLIDSAWAYWEMVPSADGEFPVAQFKPLPPLQVAHNVDEDTGDLLSEPAVYHLPHRRVGGSIQTGGSDPDSLDRKQVVIMRAPDTSESDSLYGESIATKVRQYLELITDVDTHQKRHYSDSHLPAGFAHFEGSVGDDKLEEIQQDIAEVSGDPQELVTTTADGPASWIPVGGEVADLDAIEQQKWYWKLVLAAIGLNQSELNMAESSGFAKENPELQKMVYANVTRPYLRTIMGAVNRDAGPRMAEGFGVDALPFELDLERYDPIHESIEREEQLEEWDRKTSTLAEVRGDAGDMTDEFVAEIGGMEVDLATTPRYIVDTLTQIEAGGEEDGGGSGGGEASATLGEDPVLSIREAGEVLGIDDPHAAKRRADSRAKQLDATIEVQSSFLVSAAYDPEAPFMQLEFEREGQANWTYWYGEVPEYRFFNFLRASSKGQYFNKYIKGEYQYVRVA